VTVPIDRRTFLVSAATAVAGVSGASARRRPLASKPSQTLQRAIRGRVLTPSTPGFAAAAHVYNERFDSILPQAVARPVDAADVQAAVRWAVTRGVQLRARSGGHSYAGYSTLQKGVVVDLRTLNGISVNRSSGTATVGAGAQLIDVYAGLAAHGATIPAGSCPSVGVSGVTLGGGMGLAGRAYGLTTDQIVAVQIATADGRLRTVNAKTDPDLLWALKGGGGGNFGIVTEFTFKTQPLPASAAYFFASFPWSHADAALEAWIAWAPHADARLTSIFHLNGGGGSPSAEISGQFMGSSSVLGSLLAPLRAVPGASISTGDQGYLGLQTRWAGCLGVSQAACHTVGAASGGTLPRESFNAKSDYLTKPLPAAGLSTLTQAIAARAQQPGSGAILFDSYGGAINRVSPSATAFVHRNVLCAMQYLSYNGGSQWLSETWTKMRPYVSGQAYQNYIDASLPNWQNAYYGANYARLQQVRRSVDPHHFFRFPQAIT
jgi:FAD/FMN-containing dehydrogenase